MNDAEKIEMAVLEGLLNVETARAEGLKDIACRLLRAGSLSRIGQPASPAETAAARASLAAFNETRLRLAGALGSSSTTSLDVLVRDVGDMLIALRRTFDLADTAGIEQISVKAKTTAAAAATLCEAIATRDELQVKVSELGQVVKESLVAILGTLDATCPVDGSISLAGEIRKLGKERDDLRAEQAKISEILAINGQPATGAGLRAFIDQVWMDEAERREFQKTIANLTAEVGGLRQTNKALNDQVAALTPGPWVRLGDVDPSDGEKVLMWTGVAGMPVFLHTVNNAAHSLPATYHWRRFPAGLLDAPAPTVAP